MGVTAPVWVLVSTFLLLFSPTTSTRTKVIYGKIHVSLICRHLLNTKRTLVVEMKEEPPLKGRNRCGGPPRTESFCLKVPGEIGGTRYRSTSYRFRYLGTFLCAKWSKISYGGTRLWQNAQNRPETLIQKSGNVFCL